LWSGLKYKFYTVWFEAEVFKTVKIHFVPFGFFAILFLGVWGRLALKYSNTERAVTY
jgi:hypothetical protein